MIRLLLFLFVFSPTISFADSTIENRAQKIIDKIKDDQAPGNGSFNFRTGLFQFTQNTEDGVSLNQEGIVPFIGIEGFFDLVGEFGIEARFYYAQNFLYPSAHPSQNGTSANQYSYDLGLRYTWVVDPTRSENYFGFKLLYHGLQNNFQLFNPSDTADTSKETVYVNQYQAVMLGVERSFYVTPKITVVASLDFVGITGIKTDTVQEMEDTGLGFQVRGEAYYAIDWFGEGGRVGGQYWQGSYTNKFTNVDDTNVASSNPAKTNYVQAFRAISLSYSQLF